MLLRLTLVVALGFTIALPLQGPRPAPFVDTVPGGVAAVLAAEYAGSGSTVLLPLARSGNPVTQAYALRALGRLEDPALVPELLPFLTSRAPDVRAEAVQALAQSVTTVSRGGERETVASVQRAIVATRADTLRVREAVAHALGRLPYGRAGDVKAAEEYLSQRLVYREVAAARALEALARLNPKLTSLEPDTLTLLARIVRRSERTESEPLRRNALAALLAARGFEQEPAEAALEDPSAEVRRLAYLALAGGANPFPADVRRDWLERGLSDASHLVRLEAVRAWARHESPTAGCGMLLVALGDASLHVVLAALEALGGACPDDPDITDRLVGEARTPPTIGSWHRETRAFVALARRDPERAALSMPAFSRHAVWQVRMHTARAAAAMADALTLGLLAADPHDNVVHAALEHLQTLAPEQAAGAVEAALDRSDPQLLLTAGELMAKWEHQPRLAPGLAAALHRVTTQRNDSTRDTRLALLKGFGVHAHRDDASRLAFLLQDFDPVIAEAAAAAMTSLSGRTVAPNPNPRRRHTSANPDDKPDCMAMRMENGKIVELHLLRREAPLAAARFVELARSGYYNGTSFHRVVPNFVIQGGSPGENEYSGSHEYWRDEVGPAGHERGTVGLSTRGRHTGDAQIFINLVDNPRLDFLYTVFARITHGMEAVDGVAEGDRIARIFEMRCR